MPDQKEQNEETLVQLQQDYNKLLQKYAQAENTIDSLRIGATIPINVELTATGGNSNLAAGTGNGSASANLQTGGSLAGSSHKIGKLVFFTYFTIQPAWICRWIQLNLLFEPTTSMLLKLLF